MASKKEDVESAEADGNVIGAISSAAYTIIKKSLDVNKYATKKTIAQGLLDVALLTANASQLKYVLQVGEKHEFYVLMLSLISISIILQLIVAILFVIIGGLNINKSRDHRAAIILNDVILIFIFLISVINIIISGFGLEYSNQPLKLLSEQEQVAQACLCVLLGSALNINKEDDHPNANKTNNLILCVNIVIMAVNILINSFEMKDGSGVLSGIFSNSTPGTA